MSRIINLLFFTLIGFTIQAQQQPQYTQFTDAKLFYNPAFAGVDGNLHATLLGRWQWAGFEGAPNTQGISINSRIPNKNVGLGLIINRDEVAVTDATTAQFNYAYHLPVWGGNLSMGLSGNLYMFSVNYNEAYVMKPDATFATSTRSTRANFGTGIYYQNQNWYTGVSLPFMLNNSFESNGEVYFDQKRHYYVLGGYRYQLNSDFTLEPNVLLKLVGGSPLSGDFNVTTWYRDLVAAGLSYRTSESIDVIFQFRPTDDLKVGYAYDIVVNDEVSQLARSSHEVLLSYSLPWGKKDTDRDGISDKHDRCKDVAGPASNNGCPIPDQDGDGVPDDQDECPRAAGALAFGGCPDSDGDGIEDKKDACPKAAGPERLNGCPDRDGDGLSDRADACPDVAGVPSLKGCPDSDGDGVKDSEDQCPGEGGPTSNGGCPEITQEALQLLDEAISEVQFRSGKDVLIDASYDILNRLVEMLAENPSMKLKISGYTDSLGNDQANLELSSDRALHVRDYLVSKGVAASRIQAEGYGEANPIATNDTPEGRAKNRRVEFEVGY